MSTTGKFNYNFLEVFKILKKKICKTRFGQLLKSSGVLKQDVELQIQQMVYNIQVHLMDYHQWVNL